MNNHKISVILPVYNGEKYLSDSIDSVLRQTYADFEFLIYDDNSCDSSTSIIESKQDERIKFLKNQRNLGLFKTLNLLIKQSMCKYIRLWSQDDIMKPDCLSEEIEFYERHQETGFCYCGLDLINASGDIIRNFGEDKTPEIISGDLAAQIMFYHGSIAANISTVMIKREVFRDIGFFREDMKAAADFEMWARVSKKYPIGFIHKPLVKLRSHPGQLSRSKGIGVLFMREQKEILDELLERLPPDISGHAGKYTFRRFLVMNTHYMIRSFFLGDLETAIKVYKEISLSENVFLGIIFWLVTFNGRFFKGRIKFSLEGS